ncbi:hypothetical protein LABALGNA3A7_05260 [Dellaglioa algida]|nr:hypothetical protein LABALGNA3A7_05260 [Dellaglioa algida]
MAWDTNEKAKSWVVHHDLGSGKPEDAIMMHYVEGTELVFNDTLFGGPLLGKTINFYVQAFNETFEGKDEIEKAQNANTTGYGSEWSKAVKVEFASDKSVAKADAKPAAKKTTKAVEK